MNKDISTEPAEIYRIELIQTKVSADEKIEAFRLAQSLDIPLSALIRALLKQAIASWSKGSIEGFTLEQNGMDSVLRALRPKPKGPGL